LKGHALGLNVCAAALEDPGSGMPASWTLADCRRPEWLRRRTAFAGTKYLPDSPLPTTTREDGKVRKLFTELDDGWSRRMLCFYEIFLRTSRILLTLPFIVFTARQILKNTLQTYSLVR
jgi:hypothetical protein